VELDGRSLRTSGLRELGQPRTVCGGQELIKVEFHGPQCNGSVALFVWHKTSVVVTLGRW
jgi:hypothetical protein